MTGRAREPKERAGDILTTFNVPEKLEHNYTIPDDDFNSLQSRSHTKTIARKAKYISNEHESHSYAHER